MAIIVSTLSLSGLVCLPETGSCEPRFGLAAPAPKVMGSQSGRLTPTAIRMRDGILLATDLYIPDGNGPFPIIFIRTPYDKNVERPRELREPPQHSALPSDYDFVVRPAASADATTAEFFLSHGYAVVVQDARGRHESDGEYSEFLSERNDFVDSAAWLDRQPWSAKRIGMTGCSELGMKQVLASVTHTSSLKAILPESSGGAFSSAGGRFRESGIYYGGALELAAMLSWNQNVGSTIFLRPPATLSRNDWARFASVYKTTAQGLGDFDISAIAMDLPLLGLMDRHGFPPTDWNTDLANPPGSLFWEKRDGVREGETISTPSLWVNSWNDFDVGETIDQYTYALANATSPLVANNQFIVIGPGFHCASYYGGTKRVGDYEMGEAPFYDMNALRLAWFDRMLKGDTSALQNFAHVHYFLLGKNEWQSADQFPLPGTHDTSFFLSSGRGANSRFGDGLLSEQQTKGSGVDKFTYDPADPVPTLGGNVCCAGTFHLKTGIVDQRSIEARNDVLVFTSPPLKRDLTMVGIIKVLLFVSSDAPDTDFTAKLIDVYPDGRALVLVDGIQRARYRDGYRRPVMMQANHTYPLTIDLQAFANWFPAGHRIRLDISSSSFPRFDRNLNTGGSTYDENRFTTAQNEVHFGTDTPSRLIIPEITP
jgi:putative CocE/NonD family hydrolase